jgi:hypothetical protein
MFFFSHMSTPWSLDNKVTNVTVHYSLSYFKITIPKCQYPIVLRSRFNKKNESTQLSILCFYLFGKEKMRLCWCWKASPKEHNFFTVLLRFCGNGCSKVLEIGYSVMYAAKEYSVLPSVAGTWAARPQARLAAAERQGRTAEEPVRLAWVR